MKFAIVGNNKHQRPTKGVKGFCPVCGEEVLAKCGNIKAHYWSHLANSKCVYKGNKGEWHLSWQNEFPDDWQEVLLINPENGEKNLADVRSPKGFILEFQHSHIKEEEKTAREQFYKNMCWVVDGLNWIKIRSYFENRYKDKAEENIVEKFQIDRYDYETIFSFVWASSAVPIFYDFYDKNSVADQEKWQNYLYCCFPYKKFIGFQVVPIKRQDFLVIAKEEMLESWIKDIQSDIEQTSKQKQAALDEEERRFKEEERQKREEIKRQKLITRQNAKPKADLLKVFFDAINQQKEFVNGFYTEVDALFVIGLFTEGLKIKTQEDIYNPQYNKLNTNLWIECAENAYLCADEQDIKNCNLRHFHCCPTNGSSLNDYYKNIAKNKVFFSGEIGGEKFKRVFSGYPLIVFVNKEQKTISVLCKNIVNGNVQNSFSIIHILYINGIYYHYQYYSTKHLYIFLKMVCNNNSITVQDIKIL